MSGVRLSGIHSPSNPFARVPEEERDLLRRSIMAQAKKPHPNKIEMYDEIMQEHASRMDIVRLHQRAEDAENEMRQAQLISTMEAQAQEKLHSELNRALMAMEGLNREGQELKLRLSATEEARVEAVNSLSAASELLASLKSEVVSGKREVAALIEEKKANEEKARSIFMERERMENSITQLEGQLRQQKAMADQEIDRLTELGMKSQRGHEDEVRRLTAEHVEAMSRVQYALDEEGQRAAQLEHQLEDTTTTYEAQVDDLKHAIVRANRSIDAEKQNTQDLQDQIDDTKKTIWLRKYDASSPRSPRPGYLHERESDPHAGGGGMYAGQVGFERL